MRLSKKTFLYSILISLVIVLFILIYFSLMLPSLYVDHMADDYLDSVVRVQKGYSKNRSYEGLEVRNPTGSVSLEIPFKGNRVYLAGKAFRITVDVKDKQLLTIIDQLRDSVNTAESFVDVKVPDVDFDSIIDRLKLEETGPLPDLFSYKVELDKSLSQGEVKKEKIHQISDSMFVFEGGIIDGDNNYTTYIAMGKTSDALIFSFLPVMTPKMTEIRSVVLGSLPMITAVVFLLVLIASRLFSQKIVTPIIRLAGYAEDVKHAGYAEIEPFELKEKDEIGELAAALNELYEKLQLKYRELEETNRALARENKRQEVFLRASSHQLKTPITAALLLTEGILSKIGKYKDSKKYLPEVKNQLISMQKIVEDILYLNHSADHMGCESVDLNLLIKEVLNSYRIPAEERQLTFSYEEYRTVIMTDREIMRKILDNFISNAVSYTPEGGGINIRLTENEVSIFNEGAHIEEELLPHIYDPFVSSDSSRRGRGLGLYVISYYSELLGLKTEVSNAEEGVLARLVLK